ncbi:unnamed protein product [Rhizophagus irregularis]|nr:unnamed protein product [Rhizophagus irregularis]
MNTDIPGIRFQHGYRFSRNLVVEFGSGMDTNIPGIQFRYGYIMDTDIPDLVKNKKKIFTQYSKITIYFIKNLK